MRNRILMLHSFISGLIHVQNQHTHILIKPEQWSWYWLKFTCEYYDQAVSLVAQPVKNSLQCVKPGFDLSVWKISREVKGYPLQYSGLENSMDCIVHEVTKSRTQLSDFHITPFHHNQRLTLIEYLCVRHCVCSLDPLQ